MQRKLTTILVADISGYSSMAARDEDGTIDYVKALFAQVFAPEIARAEGRIVKTMGDGFLAEFTSPVAAARCAVALFQGAAAVPPPETGDPARLRAGLHLGDVICDGDDLMGDGVNVAARLEALAQPGTICLSRAVHDLIRDKVQADITPMGPQSLRGIPQPVETFALTPHSTAPARPADREGQPPSVAVLPFPGIGPETADHLCDGIVEEITGALSRVRDFRVVARQSANGFRGSLSDPREIGRQLGVRYLLTGAVRQSGDRIRVTAELIDARTGDQMLSDRFDDRIEDLFDLQDRIASRAAAAISPSIRASEIARARSIPPEDRDAYAAYMSALPHFWAHRPQENARALNLLDQALDIAPGETRARALRSWVYAQKACYMWTTAPRDAREAALADAREAELNVTDHAPSLVALAATFGMASLEIDRARSLVDRALSIDPNSAWGWMRSGWCWNYLGEMDKALVDFARAETLSPRDPFLFNILFGRGFAHGLAGDYDQAIRLFEQGLLAGPGVGWAYRDLASFHALAGHTEAADRALGMLLEHYPDLTVQRVIDSMPPAVGERHQVFFEGLRRAGVPEA